jgi:hypothetical protein
MIQMFAIKFYHYFLFILSFFSVKFNFHVLVGSPDKLELAYSLLASVYPLDEAWEM